VADRVERLERPRCGSKRPAASAAVAATAAAP